MSIGISKSKNSRLPEKINMKKSILILLVVLLSTAVGKAQSRGISLSYSTGKALAMDIFFRKGDNRFHFGYGYQFNGQKKKVVRERESNYGLTKIEEGDFFWLVDLGYSRIVAKRLTIHPEISIGGKNYFTSYQDDRFSDDGYSLIKRSETKGGIGANISYILSDNIELFVGYHTMKKMNFGLRFSF